MEENRVSRRSFITGWADVVVEDELQSIDACISNISSNGIGLYIKRVLSPGTSTRLKLHFVGFNGLETDDEITGVVTWSFEQGKFIAVGVRFHESINRQSRPRLFDVMSDESI